MRGPDAAILLAACCLAHAGMALAAPPVHCIVEVQLPSNAAAVSGRMLLFAVTAPKGAAPKDIDADEFEPNSVTVSAQDVPYLAPGGSAAIDADTTAYPTGFAGLKPGAYLLQALLDVQRDYAYRGRFQGDLSSDVVPFTVTADAAAIPTLVLAHTTRPPPDPWALASDSPSDTRGDIPAARAHANKINFHSAALSVFWGRDITMHGWVLTPPGYDEHAPPTYPTAYLLHGYGSTWANLPDRMVVIYAAMKAGKMPPMIWVFPDQSSLNGTTEFVDSVNNGPWGQALTAELIPALEKQYRMDGRPSGRFLNGHSSGGWAALWLQMTYPSFFGGTWSTSPDPTDFHDFINVDLYSPHANMYRLANGGQVPVARMDGKAVGFIEPAAKLEAVLGNGGQFSSFDWVFSPRGADGLPLTMFDRTTGDVNENVVAYWREHYDIAHVLQANWPRLRPELTGRIHVVVGAADTFYLDGPAHRLQAVLDRLHARAQFQFIPGRGHFDLYQQGKESLGLLYGMSWDMFRLARPGTNLHPAAAP